MAGEAIEWVVPFTDTAKDTAKDTANPITGIVIHGRIHSHMEILNGRMDIRHGRMDIRHIMGTDIPILITRHQIITRHPATRQSVSRQR